MVPFHSENGLLPSRVEACTYGSSCHTCPCRLNTELRAWPPGATTRKRTCAPAGDWKIGVCGFASTCWLVSEYEKSSARVYSSDARGEYPIRCHSGSVR